ncbi:MAG: regulatory iron-sulfur-containing complex subunit RicT, partial [Candidatus Moranbacteria bacterium]|nr:regulatory iron-sulfur-containing complex subunit RicT [Candidatus Moranbacteria bacterium]
MKVLVSLYSWENPKLYASDFQLEKGDKVIVATDYANEIGIVTDVDVVTKEEPKERILRIATERDRDVFAQNEKQKEDCLAACRNEIKLAKLEMKLIDARISLDGKQIIFAFTADGRIDFRELVKNLSRQFKRLIRMQQIGSRDEARKLGGYGICGRELCCVRNNGNMQSITTDMARVQQIAHRGTDRISGLCGRLMCCLIYEAQQYKEMLVGMPEVHSTVNTPEGKGFVIEVNAITQDIKVKLESGKYISVKKEAI